MSLTNDLQVRLDELQELLERIKSGEFGPEGMSNLDDLTLSGGLTITGALTALSLGLTTPLPNNQLATPNGVFLVDFFSAGGQTTGTKKGAALVPVAATVVGVRAYVDTAPVGATFIVDVNKNGTTLFSTQGARPIVADGANASSTTLPAVTSFAAGDRLSYDIDQIGSGTAGSDLYVVVALKTVLVA